MPDIRRNFLGQPVRLTLALSLAVVLVVASVFAQKRPQVSLEISETLFTVLTAINTCGYDQELDVSDKLRAQIRSEVGKAVENAAGAQDVVAPMCSFYRQHQAAEPTHDLSHYVSLALYLEGPPAKMTFDTEIYLKMPSAGYLGRQFTVYLDAMGAPGQTNARNYASDYYVVIS